jgi:uncharacterized protein involved in type VI secretion and phage assembly
MNVSGPFSIPAGFGHGAQLARVVSVQDPEKLARVQVRLLGPDADGEALIWARVAVPFAGPNRGAFLIPDVDDEVLVMFVAGDQRSPVVVGGLWNGSQKPPESISGANVDRWTFTGTNGTRIAIVEQSQGREQIVLQTPAGVTATLTDQGGSKIELKAAGNTVTMDSSGVSVRAAGSVSVTAGSVEVSAGIVNVHSAFTKFDGFVKCAALITDFVISKAYTPGAGNIW